MSKPGKKQRERARRQRKADRRAERARTGQGSHGGSETAAASTPVRGVTAPLVDDALHWHIARTAPRLGPQGRRALDERLTKAGVVAHRPRVSEVVVRRGRRVVRHVPLVVRTLILGVRDEAHLGEVATLPGVAEIVAHAVLDEAGQGNVAGLRWKPARLEPKALRVFLTALADGEIVQPVGIKAGDSVVVMAGPFASFPATVEAILPGDRVKVGVSIFGRSSPVELDLADVQAV